ncbi:hypothetical protein ACSBO6_09790 [Bacillus sp. AL-1R]
MKLIWILLILALQQTVNDKGLLKEGYYRLYDFGDYQSGEFRYNPKSIQSIKNELEKCIRQFKKEILPIFDYVQTEKDFLHFEEEREIQEYGEVRLLSRNKLYIYLKLRNYSGALKVIEAYRKQNIMALTETYRSEFDSEDKFQHFLNDKLQKLNRFKNAIETSDTKFLDNIVQTNIKNTKIMLKAYGYKF